jgi:hypothetical protein
MAIADYGEPYQLALRVKDYDYTVNGCNITVEAYIPATRYFPEYQIISERVLKWDLSPRDFVYKQDNINTPVSLGNMKILGIDNTEVTPGEPYLAKKASTIKLTFTEALTGLNAYMFNASNSIFDLRVSYLSAYNQLDNPDRFAETTFATKKVLATAPIKLYTQNYTELIDTDIAIENIAMGSINSYALGANIISDNNYVPLAQEYINSNFTLKYNTIGIKNIYTSVYFPDSFLITELNVPYFDILNIEKTYEDYTSINKLRLQNSFVYLPTTPPRVAPNDWVVDDNINASLKTIYDAVETIIEQSRIVNPFSSKYYGWLDTNDSSWNYYINNINNNLNGFLPYATKSPIIDIYATKDKIYTIYENAIYENEKNYSNGLTSIIDRFNEYNPFTRIKTVLRDKNKKLFVLDSGSYSVGIFTKNFTNTRGEWVTSTFFGGVGGPDARNKFLQPNSMFFDNVENLHVVDSGNNCIKSFTNDGSWYRTINNSFTQKNVLIDGTVDSIGYKHILTPLVVGVIDNDDNLVTTYDIYNPDTLPLKIISDPTKDFCLIIYKNKIQKYYRDGTYIATIYGAEDLTTSTAKDLDVVTRRPCQDLYGFYWSWDALSCAQGLDLNSTTLTWRDVSENGVYPKLWSNQTLTTLANSQASDFNFNVYSASYDPNRNLYISIGGYLVKYLNNISFVNLASGFKKDYYWKLEDILINKEEIVQDWTYNKSFQRLWDNIELVRRSINFKLNIGPLSYRAQSLTNADLTSQYFYPKTDILVGANEIVTSSVVNRVIEILWKNILSLKNLINLRDTTVTTTILTAVSSQAFFDQSLTKYTLQQRLDLGLPVPTTTPSPTPSATPRPTVNLTTPTPTPIPPTATVPPPTPTPTPTPTVYSRYIFTQSGWNFN